jgi:hypothetical protein
MSDNVFRHPRPAINEPWPDTTSPRISDGAKGHGPNAESIVYTTEGHADAEIISELALQNLAKDAACGPRPIVTDGRLPRSRACWPSDIKISATVATFATLG